jgi:magnesium-transporting ATPase (P-type)
MQNSLLIALAAASIVTVAIYAFRKNDVEEPQTPESSLKYLWVFLLVAVLVYIILYAFKDDKIEVMEHIEIGDPNF